MAVLIGLHAFHTQGTPPYRVPGAGDTDAPCLVLALGWQVASAVGCRRWGDKNERLALFGALSLVPCT